MGNFKFQTFLGKPALYTKASLSKAHYCKWMLIFVYHFLFISERCDSLSNLLYLCFTAFLSWQSRLPRCFSTNTFSGDSPPTLAQRSLRITLSGSITATTGFKPKTVPGIITSSGTGYLTNLVSRSDLFGRWVRWVSSRNFPKNILFSIQVSFDHLAWKF